MIAPLRYQTVVIGGGFFGCSVAVALAEQGRKVLLCEEADALLTRASYNNQARIHNGYHYPRSVLTALRSRINFPRWIEQYRDCVVDDFEKYYAIARRFSKVSAQQFRSFMERIGAPLEPAPARVTSLFNDALIERVFTVRECAFDALKLRNLLEQRLVDTRVEVMLNTRAVKVAADDGAISVTLENAGANERVVADQVFNCTYSRINELLAASGLPRIRLKHELAEMALVEVPEPLKHVGVTVMCGPFFSVMPFPARGLHTLSHVRYTPHGEWHDTDTASRNMGAFLKENRPPTNYRSMLSDAQRYLPMLGECVQKDSLWEIKTVLPASEEDDSRPILFQRDCGLKNLHCVMGAKIDNVFDVLTECAAAV
ncbi:MAG: FAD-binding oxidoreductase [Verrucomicrobia bacterium]|nr:FAD-binding oxidoreductase [Verrucomicrobiota bacterium]